ncbi:MAG TPA: hypothetical protein VGV86_04130 [Acidimicrobiales bacterium]|nr:hypothetical protein [Acidimicrobiales bacterium]
MANLSAGGVRNAKAVDTDESVSQSTLMANVRFSKIPRSVSERLSMQTRTSRGSTDTEQTALAVNPHWARRGPRW